jgi:hypothetical protein
MSKSLEVKIRETKELWPHFGVPLLGEVYCLCWGNHEMNFGGAQG